VLLGALPGSKQTVKGPEMHSCSSKRTQNANSGKAELEDETAGGGKSGYSVLVQENT